MHGRRPGPLPRLLALLLLWSTVAAQAPYQTLVDLTPTDDAHTHNLSPATCFGADPTLNIGRVNNSPLELYRGHFLFDLSAVPPTTAVARAELHWYQTNSSFSGNDCRLHPIASPWDEGTITWSSNPSLGPEYDIVQPGGASGWYVWDVTCMARDWVAGALVNHGIVIRDYYESGVGTYRPGYGVSKEGAVGQRPFLRLLLNTGYGGDPGAPVGSVEAGAVPLTFRLVDPGGGSSSAVVTCSTDSGVSWSPATASPVSGLPGSGLGVLTTIVWDSDTDGVGLAGPTPVEVRVALDNGTSTDLATFDFQVDNSPLTPPAVVRVASGADARLRTLNWCEPHGQDPTLVLNRERGGTPTRYNRDLFRFDVSRILPGTPVLGARFNYYQYAGGGAGTQDVFVHRVTAPWDEGTVSWATTPAYDPAIEVTLGVGDNFTNGWQVFDITALVQGWVDGTVPRHGIIILGQEMTAGASRPSHGYSREHSNPTEQPFLEIDLGTPPMLCAITAPAGTTESGNVLVDYLLTHPLSTPVELTPEWSSDGGASWWPASGGPGGDGVTALSTSPGGTPHAYDWDSLADIPPGAGPTPVTVRLTMDDGSSLSSCTTLCSVDNSPPPCVSAACGDCNGDGVVSILDALRAARIDAGLTPAPPAGSVAFNDCNVHGLVYPDPGAVITILDALQLAQHAAGLVGLACC